MFCNRPKRTRSRRFSTQSANTGRKCTEYTEETTPTNFVFCDSSCLASKVMSSSLWTGNATKNTWTGFKSNVELVLGKFKSSREVPFFNDVHLHLVDSDNFESLILKNYSIPIRLHHLNLMRRYSY